MNHMLSAIKLRRIITSNLNIKSDCPINIIPAPSFPQIGVETSAFDFYDDFFSCLVFRRSDGHFLLCNFLLSNGV